MLSRERRTCERPRGHAARPSVMRHTTARPGRDRVYPTLSYREEQVDEIIRTDDTSSRWLEDGIELLLALLLPDDAPAVVDEPGDVVVEPAPADPLDASE